MAWIILRNATRHQLGVLSHRPGGVVSFPRMAETCVNPLGLLSKDLAAHEELGQCTSVAQALIFCIHGLLLSASPGA